MLHYKNNFRAFVLVFFMAACQLCCYAQVKTVKYYGDKIYCSDGKSVVPVSELYGYIDVCYGSGGKAYAYSVDGGTQRPLDETQKNGNMVYYNIRNSKDLLAIDEEGQYVNASTYNWAVPGTVLISRYTLTPVKHNGNNMIGGQMNMGGNPGTMSGGNSSGGSVYTKCNICGGSGVCRSCNGRGGEWRDVGGFTGSDKRSWIECPSCRGNRKCYMCYGSGRY